MLPTPEVFAEIVGNMGISNDTHVVVYDASQSIGAAARVLWTFRAFGHSGGVSVLDGGLRAWEAEGYPVATGSLGTFQGEESPVQPKTYRATINKQLVKTFEDMRENMLRSDKERVTVIDARPAGRFLGIDPEPRPGLSSGHLPHSISLPHIKLLDKTPAARLLGSKELVAGFADAGVALSEPAIHTCGSGVNASVTWLAQIIARNEIKSGGTWEEVEDGLSVYDGSWTEWAARVADGAVVEK
ncbi:hypothetical protein HDU82_000005 [Entophlyctis luteolus]|nr:hypothetical protein HDU82_000005 [Entophlyctis luteolus]